MMKVYVVMHYYYWEIYSIDKVFDSEEKAKIYVELKDDPEDNSSGYYYKEREIE